MTASSFPHADGQEIDRAQHDSRLGIGRGTAPAASSPPTASRRARTRSPSRSAPERPDRRRARLDGRIEVAAGRVEPQRDETAHLPVGVVRRHADGLEIVVSRGLQCHQREPARPRKVVAARREPKRCRHHRRWALAADVGPVTASRRSFSRVSSFTARFGLARISDSRPFVTPRMRLRRATSRSPRSRGTFQLRLARRRPDTECVRSWRESRRPRRRLSRGAA